VLFGTFEAASMCMLFAATYPERTLGLVLYNPVAKGTWSPEYPWAPTAEEWRRQTEDEIVANWGTYAQAQNIALWRYQSRTATRPRHSVSCAA
jgi:pimeloyl-ACP methyl ester carboxylesterase